MCSARRGKIELSTADGAHMQSAANFAQKYRMGEKLGSGAFGVVHAGWERKTGRRVAIKVINVDAMGSHEEAVALKREIDVLAANKHPHVVEFIEGFVTYKFGTQEMRKVQIVMELCEGGELFDVLNMHHDGQEEGCDFSEAEAKLVMRPLLEALAFIHSHRCIHRDIKPENILLSDPKDLGSVHIADFGVAAQFSDHEEMVANDVAGTLYFFAPEVLREQGAGPGVDVWAAGIVLHLMLTGIHPFDRQANGDECSTRQLCLNIMQCGHGAAPLNHQANGSARGPNDPQKSCTLALPSYLSPSVCELLRAMLHDDPNQRTSAVDALKFSWLSQPLALTSLPDAHQSEQLEAAKVLPLVELEAHAQPLPSHRGENLASFHAKRQQERLAEMSDSHAPNSATDSRNGVDITPCTPRKRGLSIVTPAMRRLRSIAGAEQLLHKAAIRLQCRHRGHRSRHEQKQNIRHIVTVQAIARGARVRLGWNHVLGSKRLPQSLQQLHLILQEWHQPVLPAYAVTKREFAALFCNTAAVHVLPGPGDQPMPAATGIDEPSAIAVSSQSSTKEPLKASEPRTPTRTPSRPTQSQSTRSRERQLQRWRASNKRHDSVGRHSAVAVSAADDAHCDSSDPEVDRIFAAFAGDNGGERVHVLLVFASIAMMCTGTTNEKLHFIFQLFDMGAVGTLNKDQLTILFTLCEQSFALVSGCSMPTPERATELADSVLEYTGSQASNVESVSAMQHAKVVGLDAFCKWATAVKDVGNFVMRVRKCRCRELVQSSPAVFCIPNTQPTLAAST